MTEETVLEESAGSDEAAAPEDDVELRWAKSLWSREPWKRYVVLGCAVLAAIAGYLMMGHPLHAVIGLVAVLGVTAEFWLPLRFKMDGKGASVRCGFSVTAIEWPSVKRAIRGEEGIKLSPLERSGRTSPFRGVFLRFEGNEDEVRAFVEAHLPKHARTVEYGTDA